MSNLGILLKNSVNCTLGHLQGKKARKRTSIVVSLIVLIALGIYAVFALEVYGLFESMGKIGLGEIPLFNSIEIMLMIVLVIAFQNISGKSKTNDSDMLLSMPIRKVDIVLSKTLSKYLLDLIIIFLVALPTFVLYSIFIEFSAATILWGFYILFMLPLLGIGVNYIVEFLIIKVFNRTRFSIVLKVVFAILIYGALIAVYIYNSVVMGMNDATTVDAFLNRNFIIGWCVKLMVRNDMICLLWITLITVLPFVLGVGLYTSVFGKTYLKYQNKSKVHEYRKIGKFDGLLGKEFRTYIMTPIYIFNTVIGPIMLIAMTVFLCIEGRVGMSNMFMGLLGDELIFAIIVLVFLFLTSTTLTSCCSVSLEGRYIWILKSSPISERKALIAKSLINMFLFVPIHLICSVLICALFKANAFEWIMLIFLPLLMNTILSFGGTYINILLPKLEWETEAQVVKSSLSVFVTMMFGFVLVIIPLVMNISGLSVLITGYVTLGLFIALCVATIAVLLTDGVKRFRKL